MQTSQSATQPLNIHRVPLDSLHLDPANARAHGDRNLDSIADSLKRFGQTEPLVVQASTGRVIGGNGRLEVMRKLGWVECDVVQLDIDGLEATALGIALNRTAETATWCDETLGRLLAELRAEGALDGVGFDDGEVDELLAELDAGSRDVDDPGPGAPPASPVSRPGDLWVLGDHRILCGDSTCPEDMARLMGDAKAALLATDPPYLVDYKGAAPAASKPGCDSPSSDKHWDDFNGDAEGLAFFTAFLDTALPHCIERVPVYQWHAHRRQALVERAWLEVGLLVHQQIIWVKSRGTLGRSFYMWAHEPCFVGWPKGKMPQKDRRPPLNATTVWDIEQAGEQSVEHPTQKPLEIFARPIEAHTKAGEIVLESFSGSGSQIICAEQLGRRCHAIEKDPAYVDVAVRRWEKATGKVAVLDGDGRSFAEVAAERGGDESAEVTSSTATTAPDALTPEVTEASQ